MSADMAVTPMNVERREQIFPTLTESQLQRISRYGTRRTVQDGEILFRQGDEGTHFFVILRGELDIVQPHGEGETLIVRHQAGDFTGETAMLSGRRALASGEAKTQLPGPTIQDRVFSALDVAAAAVDFFVADSPTLITESRHLAEAKNRLVGVGAVRGDSARFGKNKYWVVVVYAKPR